MAHRSVSPISLLAMCLLLPACDAAEDSEGEALRSEQEAHEIDPAAFTMDELEIV